MAKRERSKNEPRPLAGLLGFARWTIVPYLVFGALFLIVSAGGLWYDPAVLIDEFAYPETPLENMLLIAFGGAAVGFYLVFFVSIVAVGRFTFRAMRNLHLMDEPEAQMSPGWTVGWYFIPFANLFKPVQGMREIVDGTWKQAGKGLTDTPSLSLWWGTWIAGSVVGNVSDAFDDPTAAVAISAISVGLLMASAWFLLGHLRRIADLQDGVMAARVF